MHVMVVDDEAGVRKLLVRAIQRVWLGARVTSVASFPEAAQLLDEACPDVLAADLMLPPDPSKLLGIGLIDRMRKAGRGDRSIVVTGAGREAIDRARRAGARVVLTKPFGEDELRGAGREMGIPLAESSSEEPALAALVGESPAMQSLRGSVRRVARADGPVLIQGETGTGKELVARAIHALHGRGPFQAVNCSTLDTLTESQLFGHARGSFTSADRGFPGAIEQADDGVLFLDEIGDLPRTLQPKLLRALDGYAFQPLGDTRQVEIRARVVAASHVDLESLVAERSFRDDLYWRLAVHLIRVPSLSDRAEDVPTLAQAIVRGLRRPTIITSEAAALLAQRDWPGNVRQLRGTLERMAVWADGGTIDVRDVLALEASGPTPRPVRNPGPVKAAPAASFLLEGTFEAAMSAHERMLLDAALRQSGGNVAAAARSLGLERMALVRRLRRRQ
jgi:DNA-binding NtrC family response regulator